MHQQKNNSNAVSTSVSPREIETLQQTRVRFGSAPSPFLLRGTLNRHLENCQENYPVIVQLVNTTYVDDVISGGGTVEKVQKLTKLSGHQI